MRKIFILLLLVNLALLGFSHYQDNYSNQNAASRVSDVGNLAIFRADEQMPQASNELVTLGEENQQDESAMIQHLRAWDSGIGDCAVVTGIKDAFILTQLAQDLNAIDIASFQSEKQSVTDLFRVVVPPMASRETATHRMQELKQAGFSDLWLIGHGPLKNALSMGVFTNKTSADIYANRVLTRGFEVQVQPMKKIDDYYELSFTLPSTLEAFEDIRQTWLSEKKLDVKRMDCINE